MAIDSQFTAVTNRLCRLLGTYTLTGSALAAEIGDKDRFKRRTIASCLGLVPMPFSETATPTVDNESASTTWMLIVAATVGKCSLLLLA